MFIIVVIMITVYLKKNNDMKIVPCRKVEKLRGLPNIGFFYIPAVKLYFHVTINVIHLIKQLFGVHNVVVFSLM